MEQLFLTTVTTGSPLIVLVLVVYLFLQHLKERDKMLIQQLNAMNQQHLEAREQMKDALLQNAQSTRENTKALQSLERAVAHRI